MRKLLYSLFSATCFFMMVTTLMLGCSGDDNNPVAPTGTWSWASLGSGIGGHLPRISALASFDGRLVAGGQFSEAGGNTAYNIAAWDDTSWTPLGPGQGLYGASAARVCALTVSGGELIAGGDFTLAGITSVNYVAAWDGSSWSPLSSGMDSCVFALIVYDNKLIAGGAFSQAGGSSVNRIAAWDGSSWTPLGTGVNGMVFALTVYDGKLIAGGQFTEAGGNSANHIAIWDGASWSPMGSGMNNYDVSSLTVYSNRPIAGGSFSEAGGIGANQIASWDDSSWSPLGSGTNTGGYVLALASFGNELIAGGDFLQAGGAEAKGIASWNGTSWKSLSSGVSGRVGGNWPTVFCLTVRDTRLYVGGQFTAVDSTTVNCVAEWSFK